MGGQIIVAVCWNQSGLTPGDVISEMKLVPDRMSQKFTFVTDTSTLCVYDLACLKHRIDDDADWWSLPEEELEEVNKGNVAFLGLGVDGKYVVSVVDEPINGGIQVALKCRSGKVFIGAGEEVTSDGMEAEAIRGGGFYELPVGNFLLNCTYSADHQIALHFQKTDQSAENSFEVPLEL